MQSVALSCPWLGFDGTIQCRDPTGQPTLNRWWAPARPGQTTGSMKAALMVRRERRQSHQTDSTIAIGRYLQPPQRTCASTAAVLCRLQLKARVDRDADGSSGSGAQGFDLAGPPISSDEHVPTTDRLADQGRMLPRSDLLVNPCDGIVRRRCMPLERAKMSTPGAASVLLSRRTVAYPFRRCGASGLQVTLLANCST